MDAGAHNDVIKALTTHFYEDGFCQLPSALSVDTVKSFVAGVEAELKPQGVSLTDASTWPGANARRVYETLPIGGDPCWMALKSSPLLGAALDSIVGPGAWELNVNTLDETSSQVETRHWYCPVAFPEEVPAKGWPAAASLGAEKCSEGSAASSTAVPSKKKGCRVAELISCADEAALRGALRVENGDEQAAVSLAATRWQPVNRRRFLNKGWHIDVGPGFPNAGPRTVAGDYRQGVVMLVLLSDCFAGCGGTALVPRSHFSVLSELEGAEIPGASVQSHEQVNTAFVKRMRVLTETKKVVLQCSSCAETHETPCCFPGPASLERGTLGEAAGQVGPVVRVTQIVGRAGDIILMHPLLLHSGTMNAGWSPRIMANGMARVKVSAFDDMNGTPTSPITTATLAAREQLFRRAMGEPTNGDLFLQILRPCPDDDAMITAAVEKDDNQGEGANRKAAEQNRRRAAVEERVRKKRARAERLAGGGVSSHGGPSPLKTRASMHGNAAWGLFADAPP